MSEDLATDVAVIGGGIVGTAAAALLAERGVGVSLYEREAIAAGASGRNSGVIQDPFDPALHALYERSLALYRRLDAERIGFTLGAEPAGLLLVSRDEQLVRSFAAHLEATSPHLAPEAVGKAALHELEPALAPDVVACRMATGFPVTPASGTYAFATLAERLGARLRLGRDVTLAVEAGRAVGVRVDGRLEPAGSVLVAAGPWTPDLLDPGGEWRPIRAQWGVVVDTVLPSAPRHVLEEAELEAALGTPEPASGTRDVAPGTPDVEPGGRRGASSARITESGFSLITAGGVSCVGSTFLDAAPVLEAWQVPLLERAASFVPAIADAPIRGLRACARPVSLDGRPIIGPVPWIERCFVAAGHGLWGISTGPGSAELVVEAMLGMVRDAVAREFDVARFGLP